MKNSSEHTDGTSPPSRSAKFSDSGIAPGTAAVDSYRRHSWRCRDPCAPGYSKILKKKPNANLNLVVAAFLDTGELRFRETHEKPVAILVQGFGSGEQNW